MRQGQLYISHNAFLGRCKEKFITVARETCNPRVGIAYPRFNLDTTRFPPPSLLWFIWASLSAPPAGQPTIDPSCLDSNIRSFPLLAIHLVLTSHINPLDSEARTI